MTAKHVIEKLKHEDNWYIVAKDYHEIALIFNALLDADKEVSIFTLTKLDLDYAIIKSSPLKCTTDWLSYKDIANLVLDEKDITEWFFREVNNY